MAFISRQLIQGYNPPSFLGTKRIPYDIGEWDSYMNPFARFSLRYSSKNFTSFSDNSLVHPFFSILLCPSRNSILWSHGQCSSNAVSFLRSLNNSLKSQYSKGRSCTSSFARYLPYGCTYIAFTISTFKDNQSPFPTLHYVNLRVLFFQLIFGLC